MIKRTATQPTIEAYGIKPGFYAAIEPRHWQKTFTSELALSAWLEKNDATLHGVRQIEESR